MMRWPNRSDYDKALGNPGVAFKTESLRSATVSTLGIGRIVSGGRFACVAKGTVDGQLMALRFFIMDQKDLKTRYDAISRMRTALKPYFVEFHYLEDEIAVANRSDRFPVMMMEWVDGETLGSFVTSACRRNDRDAMSWVRTELTELRRFLSKHEVAHGDLSAENIIIRSGDAGHELRLVDYDGVWIKSIDTLQTSIGVGPLQHPLRPNPIGANADVMAFEIFDLALSFLQGNPDTGINGGLFDQRFLLSKDDLLSGSSDLAQTIRQACPFEYERAAEYAKGDYDITPHCPLEPRAKVRESISSLPKTIGVKQVVASDVTINELARTLLKPRAEILRFCNQQWPHRHWSASTVLSPPEVQSVTDWCERGKTQGRPTKKVSRQTEEPCWEGRILDLAETLGLGTRQVRTVLQRSKSIVARFGVIVPHSNTDSFSLPIVVMEHLEIEARLLKDQFSKGAKRKAAISEAKQTFTSHPPTTSERDWTHTVTSLAAMFGVMRSDVRDALSQAQLTAPALDDLYFKITDSDLGKLEVVISSKAQVPVDLPINTRATSVQSSIVAGKNSVTSTATTTNQIQSISTSKPQYRKISVNLLAIEHNFEPSEIRSAIKSLTDNGVIKVPLQNSYLFSVSDAEENQIRIAIQGQKKATIEQPAISRDANDYVMWIWILVVIILFAAKIG